METGAAEHFTELGSLGIEEEYYIVDNEGAPVSGTDELVYESDPPDILDGRLDHELFKFVLEAQTPVCESRPDAEQALATMRSAVVDHADDHGYHIAAAGLHPTARWRELDHAEKPRYRSQLDRIQYPQHRNITAGLHIHVGVNDAEKAVWVANELRWYLPVILALSANSPYWYGFDTGLHSARAKIFEALPNTGMPTAFESFAAFAAYERAMVELGAIRDRGEIWFDVRPHTELGTVEVRTPDAQAAEWRVLAIVEYIHALVMDRAMAYDDGASPTPVRREILDENKWRAIRHGRGASFIQPNMQSAIALSEIVREETDRLGINGIERLLEAESGAVKQRRIAEDYGIEAVPAHLML